MIVVGVYDYYNDAAVTTWYCNIAGTAIHQLCNVLSRFLPAIHVHSVITHTVLSYLPKKKTHVSSINDINVGGHEQYPWLMIDMLHTPTCLQSAHAPACCFSMFGVVVCVCVCGVACHQYGQQTQPPSIIIMCVYSV